MRVHVVCKDWKRDRVLPRFTRHLVSRLGWSAARKPDARADLNYWMPYYEACRYPDFDATPTAAYITHLDDPEVEPELHRQYSDAAGRATLRVCMNQATRCVLEAKFGPTVVPPLPVELDHFTLKQEPPGDPPMVGFSGYGYRSGRKGSELAEALVERFGQWCRFRASGRKWPCPTKKYRWKDMPGFFRALDVYVCTALIEGGPMTTLEALASGIPVVVPQDVGIHPELSDVPGICRYRTGDADDLGRALEEALEMRGKVDREALRAAVGPHSVEAWCEGHLGAFRESLMGCAGLRVSEPDE